MAGVKISDLAAALGLSKDQNRNAYMAQSQQHLAAFNSALGQQMALGAGYGLVNGYTGYMDTSVYVTAGTTATAGYTIGCAPNPARKKTNLEWLDERVNEMRVVL